MPLTQRQLKQIFLSSLLTLFTMTAYAQMNTEQSITKLEPLSSIQKNPETKDAIVKRTKELEEKINTAVKGLRIQLRDNSKRNKFDNELAAILYSETDRNLAQLKMKDIIHSEESIVLEPGTDLEAASQLSEKLIHIQNQLSNF
jgi:hypothetical protein